MSLRLLHVIDLSRAAWPALASLALMQRAEGERKWRADAVSTLAFGQAADADCARALELRLDALRPSGPAVWQALVIAQRAKRLGANVAHAWCERSRIAATLASKLAPNVRVACTLSEDGASQQRGLRAVVAPSPLRAARLNAKRSAEYRRRWGAPAGALVIAHLGEPERVLDAHSFASSILALRLLGLDAFGVTSAKARSITAGVDLARRLAKREILAFEPLPPITWLGACDAGLWGAFDESVAAGLVSRGGVGAAGAAAACALGVPLAVGPEVAAGAQRLTARNESAALQVASSSKSISLAGAIRRALAHGRAAIMDDDAQALAAWLADHEALWESLRTADGS